MSAIPVRIASYTALMAARTPGWSGRWFSMAWPWRGGRAWARRSAPTLRRGEDRLHPLAPRGERRREVGRLRAPALAEVGAAPALAAQGLRQLAHDLAGVNTGAVTGDGADHGDLVPLDPGEHDHARAQLVAQPIDRLAQGLRVT